LSKLSVISKATYPPKIFSSISFLGTHSLNKYYKLHYLSSSCKTSFKCQNN